jgi:hypothetical protein
MAAPPIPALTDIGFGIASHKPALRVVRALYFDFGRLREAEKGVEQLRKVRVVLAVYLHALPLQLIASTVVDLCNTQGKAHADAGVLEQSMAKAVVSGDSVLAELMLYRSEDPPSAWSYLAGFRTKDAQPSPADDETRLTLKRHLLVKETPDGQWMLRVPLMQRWLRERT